MILIDDLLAIARARLEDVAVLLSNTRTDGAEHLCGYAVELALKARICRTLNWPGFPETRSEFQDFASFRTHKLVVLLSLTGQEERIKREHLFEWSAVEKWDPESRYRRVGYANFEQVALMWGSAETLMKVL
jgi:HEPN domain-containing protein